MRVTENILLELKVVLQEGFFEGLIVILETEVFVVLPPTPCATNNETQKPRHLRVILP